jgi:hypothetical protein
VEEEVRIVSEGDLLVILEDAELNNRGRVNWTTIGTRLRAATTGTGALRLLDYLEIIANLPAILGGADRLALRLVADSNASRRHGGWWVVDGCSESACRVVVESQRSGTAQLHASGRCTYVGDHTIGSRAN